MPWARRVVAAAIACSIAGGASAAERPMTLVRSRTMSVLGRQPARMLREVARQLEQFHVVLGGLIANADRPLAQPTFVYVFGSEKEFEPFKPLYNGVPGTMGGYFFHDEEVNDIALKLDAFDESSRIVFHEYTHLLVHGAARSIPLWLDEGLAEYYSTYALDPGGRRADIGRPIPWHIAILREQFIPLADLIAVDRRSRLYNERDRKSIFYAEVWALTHYLMTAVPDGPDRINRYATAIAEGALPPDAFAAAFGKVPAAFEKDLRIYIRGFIFNSRIFTLNDPVQVEAPDEGRTLTMEEAEAWLGDLQRRAGRLKEATGRIERAAGADAAMPQLAKAWLRLEQKRPDEAWPAFDRAVALAPDDFSTQFAYGVALLRHEIDSGRYAGNTPAVARARVALTKAAAANPASSDSFAWLAYAEMLTDGRLDAAAAAISRAIELAPGRLDYLLRRADIDILAGSIDAARRILEPVSRVATDKTASDAAKRRLAEVDESERRARAMIAARDAQRRAAEQQETERREAFDRRDEPPETVGVAKPVPLPRLRAVQRGEERAYGELIELECRPAEVRMHLKVGSRIVVATAARLKDVVVRAFVAEGDYSTACGTRPQPTPVYLTWRAAPHRVDGGATIVGTAVAIEFVPRGYTP